jgi:hypothetical protein
MTRGQRYVIGFGIGIAIAAAITHKAHAHDVWEDGQKVDPVTKRLCCSVADCHTFPVSKVHILADGVRLEDTGEVLPMSRVQPSPDGETWVCRWAKETQCFFMPPFGS